MSGSWRAAIILFVVLLVVVAIGLSPDNVRWIRTEWSWANAGLGWLELKSVNLNAAHLAMFFGVGLVMAIALLPGARLGRAGLVSLVLLVLIAVFSEAAQLAIPGRTARLSDVRDNVFGGLAGWVLGLAMRGCWRFWRTR